MIMEKIFCDECRDEIVNAECDPNQMRFVLAEHMDDGMTFQFCGAECLKSFVAKKEFENRFYRWRKVTTVCKQCKNEHSTFTPNGICMTCDLENKKKDFKKESE